ncbi:membrane protein [Clostridium novyi A str. 4552]|uniref:Membrane protein n=1 Tax=Clostridium novyi A str. 4552 TaxID=1444289 RepID=A0A0A0I1A6_CLONO|nr:hypothetical protein [Clostridium novyi]KGM94106.1 membrane protein [Clostridium novyi A str. 4552]
MIKPNTNPKRTLNNLNKIAFILSLLSIGIFIIQILFILNWMFNITPLQKLEGLPLLLTPFISPIGIVLGIISILINHNKLAKIGCICNIISLFLPYIYFYLGTLIFGP